MHIAAEVCGEVEIFKLREAAAAHPCAAPFVWELEVPPKNHSFRRRGACVWFSPTRWEQVYSDSFSARTFCEHLDTVPV